VTYPFYGANLGADNYYTNECPFINRLSMSSAPFNDTAACDPVTLLPTKAGSVSRQVPLDPIDTSIVTNPTSHDYVFLCDANVASVSTPWGTVKPVNGRATFTIKSASTGVGLVITATGPVTKMAFMRLEHEQLYLSGEIFNPDFLTRVSPFGPLRLLDWNATNADYWPARRPLPTDANFNDATGGMAAEIAGALAQKLGVKLWYPIHHLMPDSDIMATAMALASYGAEVDFEWSNEYGWTYHRTYAYAAAAAHYNLTKAAYSDVLSYYGWRAGQVAKLVSSVSPKFKINLASQASDGASNLPAILKGWDESGAPRSLIAGYANASYLNMNDFAKIEDFVAKYVPMMNADDKAGFIALLQSKVAPLALRHQKAAAACAAAGIAYKVYEGDMSLYLQAPWVTDANVRNALLNWILPIAHSEPVAGIIMSSLQTAWDAGATEVCFFELSGPGSQYGVWGEMPHITLPAYPIYYLLTAQNQATKDKLAAEAAAAAAAARKAAEDKAAADAAAAAEANRLAAIAKAEARAKEFAAIQAEMAVLTTRMQTYLAAA